MAFEHLTFDIGAGVAVLTLRRPETRNALSIAMLRELQRVLDILETPGHGARALLITGAGDGFCSGADLSDSERADPDDPENLVAVLKIHYHPFFLRLGNLAMPVIAAVNGPAAGAGMSLAISCDIVIAARSAYFYQAFINIGLIPDAGSTYLLPRLIGPARATAMMMLGERVGAELAEEWGLIWKCVDDDALMDEAMGLAARLAKGPTRAHASIRKALAQSRSNTYAGQLDLEYELQHELQTSADFYEGVAAFLAKRGAEFKGE